ncbi:unnamed protein product [Dovyalis caffra]|uniref:Uncharacterized protein n=1 Tax=Dovyalis caffra TaxID=77055 RepID=A0AAV1S8R4_9ROSI|nr:unnamed protein product [Dovyalis caffra]
MPSRVASTPRIVSSADLVLAQLRTRLKRIQEIYCSSEKLGSSKTTRLFDRAGILEAYVKNIHGHGFITETLVDKSKNTIILIERSQVQAEEESKLEYVIFIAQTRIDSQVCEHSSELRSTPKTKRTERRGLQRLTKLNLDLLIVNCKFK